eukprot:1370848-Amorphochlora_amoeboformis.AAC.2
MTWRIWGFDITIERKASGLFKMLCMKGEFIILRIISGFCIIWACICCMFGMPPIPPICPCIIAAKGLAAPAGLVPPVGVPLLGVGVEPVA